MNATAYKETRFIQHIVGEDYKRWIKEFVLFDAGTGSGKTYFVLHILAPYIRSLKKTMLYLCNRRKLREEIEAEVKRLKLSNVSVMSYQKMQSLILEGKKLHAYEYIVFDEIHYLTSDAFNEYTDVAYTFLMSQLGKSVCILMSATAKSLFDTLIRDGQAEEKYRYRIVKNHSYVDKVYFYKAQALTTLIDSIRKDCPDDKIVVFCNSANRLLDMYDHYREGAHYFCSENNTLKQLDEINEPNCIVEYAHNHISFERPILFTTKVMDNGIDLKDETIRHVFTEIFDLDSMIQSLGRKRCLNPSQDHCTYYIKNYTVQAINCFKHQVDYHLRPMRLLIEDRAKFDKLYGGDLGKKLSKNKIIFGHVDKADPKSSALSIIDSGVISNSTLRINSMAHSKYEMQSQEIENMLELGYIAVASEWLGPELSSKAEELEIEPEKRDVFLEYLQKFKGQYLYKDERELLKQEFVKVGLRDRTMGINTLNGKLKDMKYPFTIISKKDRRRVIDGKMNFNYDKKYWMIE